jgi:hypothetical protein
MFILKDTRSVKILTAFLCILAKFMVCIHHSHKQLVISAVVLFSHHDVQMLCLCTVSNQQNHGAMTIRVMNRYPFYLIKVEQFFLCADVLCKSGYFKKQLSEASFIRSHLRKEEFAQTFSNRRNATRLETTSDVTISMRFGHA